MKRAIIVLFLLAAGGAGGWMYYQRSNTQEISVNTSPVTRGDIVDAVGSTGTLGAVTTVQVGTQVSGIIEWLGADFNSIVKKDQVIARLDPSLIQAQLESSNANLTQSRASLTRAQIELDRQKILLQDVQQKYARAKELFDRQLTTQSDLETAKTNLDSAQANVLSQAAAIKQSEAAVTQSEANYNQQKVNLEHTIIKAPIDGIVTQRSVDVGQTVAASMNAPTLFILAADLTRMQMQANIDEADIGRIRPGQHVTFRVDAYPTEQFEGAVSQVRLNPLVVQNVTTYATIINVQNNELKLKPGMTATLRVEVAKRTDVLRVPAAVGTGNALTTLRQTQPNLWADVNHRLELQADDSVHYGRRLIGLTRPEPFCGGGVRIGLVDTAVDANHPALRGRQIESRSFLSAGVPPADPDHGTATAAMLVGNSLPSGFSGLAPAARLYSANVFRKRGNQADTTVEAVVQAFDWLAGQNVHIVNLSLGGPRNLLLEAAVERLLARGIAVVAAAGNRGPSAPPMYPAAQPGVIAVTAVDAELKPYKLANRGDYISFAAPGVDVWTALPGKEGAYVSGTSYATPFVTAALVAARALDPKGGWAGIQKKMQAQARDLGDQGKDPVFGFGLIQIGGCGRTSMGGR